MMTQRKEKMRKCEGMEEWKMMDVTENITQVI